MKFVLHCADLSTCLFPPPLSQRLSSALSSEFDAQAATEKSLGLPVTVMLAATPEAKAKMESGARTHTHTLPSSTFIIIFCLAYVSTPHALSPHLTSLHPGFLRFVVAPCFVKLAGICPSAGVTLSLLDANLTCWERLCGATAVGGGGGDGSGRAELLKPLEEWRAKLRRASVDAVPSPA